MLNRLCRVPLRRLLWLLAALAAVVLIEVGVLIRQGATVYSHIYGGTP